MAVVCQAEAMQDLECEMCTARMGFIGQVKILQDNAGIDFRA